MTWLDIVILALVALSAGFGAFRGFVREVLSLAVWLLSFWIASRHAGDFAVPLEGLIPHEDARVVAAFIALFFIVLIVGMVVNRLVGKLVRASGISGDRTLGAAFGLLRGIVIVALLVMATAITPLAQDRAWQESLFAGPLESLAARALGALKSGLGEHILPRLPDPLQEPLQEPVPGPD